MEVKGARMIPFSGLPFLFSAMGVLMLILAGYLEGLIGYNPGIIPIILFLLSSGTSVEVRNNELLLHYGFGKLAVRIGLEDIRELTLLNRLERGVIMRYFKGEAFIVLILLVCAIFDMVLMKGEGIGWEVYGDVLAMIFLTPYFLLLMLPFRSRWITYSVGFICAGLALILPMMFHDAAYLFWGPFWTAVVIFMLREFYSKDYVLLKTEKGMYLIATDDGSASLSTIRGEIS
ncbi:hypothetical protein E3E26_04220 [Thermococcus sp. LS1]|uniref:hypothetical protein n=1 Tax=Thermococcus sp. LS1 TaxID=1638259 RepID=UPI001438A0A9|nr:hypothetical protein [Thermococcus sp. LS1]NJD98992.1 hypothetical protein [Thermococcus sp. LS1]